MSGEATIEGFAKRYAVNEQRFGISRRSVKELPIIDVGALVFDGGGGEKATVASQIRDACINSGFFYIENFGISEQEMRDVADTAIRFYQSPPSSKEKARATDFAIARGYQPMRSETITPGYEPDHKEYYDIGAEFGDADLAPVDRGTTLWPDESEIPGFQAVMRAHTARTLKLAQTIVRGFALALDLPETYFDEAHRRPFFDVRPSYYPPASKVLKPNLWSCGPHTDYMSMTMLWQDDVGGLQVLNLDGEWIEAPPKPGTMVLNIADMMSIWTNDLFTSNPHRVANRTTRSRLSLAHFMGPGADTVVECLPTCHSAINPPRYPSTTTTQHVINILAQTQGEDYVKSAERTNSEVTDALRAPERIGG